MSNDFIEIKKISKELLNLLNNPYHFYKDIVILCEEKEIERYKNVICFFHTNDHKPLHFHIQTKNKEIEYKIYLSDDFTISSYERIKGRFKSSELKNISYWYNEKGGKEKVISTLKELEYECVSI